MNAVDLKSVLMIGSFCLALPACSAHFDAPNAANLGNESANKVTEAPRLDGEWVSVCIRETSFTSLQYRLKYIGEQVERRTDRFTESNVCQGKVTAGSVVKATFSAIRQYGPGHYQLEYRSSDALKYQFVRAEGEKLWMGPEHYFRDLADDAKIEMRRALSLPPHTGPAVLATEWRNARYAFCSNQGYATLIDLSRSDLQEGMVRSPRAKVWNCHRSPVTVWRDLDAGRITGGRESFELRLTGFTDIQINHSGYAGAYKQFPFGESNIGGNSGECFFIQDDNVRGLNFASACE